MFAISKALYLGPFWVNFSTLLRNALDFQWYDCGLKLPNLVFGTPTKNVQISLF